MSIECPVTDCSFKLGENVPNDCKASMLQLHLVEHQKQLNVSVTAKPDKLRRPSLTVGSSTEEWNYFSTRWTTYKTATKLTGSDVIVQLLECCDEPLRKDMTRVHKTASW